jgi:acetoacetyl-CoA reductase
MTKRVALITGGAGELGRAICERLASQDCRIVAMDISVHNGAGAWQQRMQAAGHELTLVQGDVTCFESCADTITRVEESVGPVDILVNCAGITRDAKLTNMDPDMWNAVLTTNLDSVFNITRQVVNGMTQRGFGRIINISSLNGEKGQFGQTNYSAAKAGMHGFTMALAQEVARKGLYGYQYGARRARRYPRADSRADPRRPLRQDNGNRRGGGLSRLRGRFLRHWGQFQR